MLNTKNTIIKNDEIKKLFLEYVEENDLIVDDLDKEFYKFVNFCETDFYDWIRGNIKQHFKSE